MLHRQNRQIITPRPEQPGRGAVLPRVEEQHQDATQVGDEYELQQHEEFGPVPPLNVRVDGPAMTHELPTKLAVCRTLAVLSPERLLPFDERRSKATLIANVQGLRLARAISELKLGGAGQVGVASSGTGPQFSSSGGGTGGFLLPIGVPIVVYTQDALFCCSDDYGVGNNACLVSLIIEQWAD